MEKHIQRLSKPGASLAFRERSVFAFLWNNPRSTRAAVARYIYGSAGENEETAITTIFGRIRKKLGPSTILTEENNTGRKKGAYRIFSIRSQRILHMVEHKQQKISHFP